MINKLLLEGLALAEVANVAYNCQWVRLAFDGDSREIVGVFVGDRSRQSATKLWQSLPAVYRQFGIFSTDFWEAYQQVLPSKCHRAVGKETGKTSYIERFYNTLHWHYRHSASSQLPISS